MEGNSSRRLALVRVHYHIYYHDTGSESENVAVRAHEETHVLDDCGFIDLLTEKILREQRVMINVSQFADKERISYQHSSLLFFLPQHHHLTTHHIPL